MLIIGRAIILFIILTCVYLLCIEKCNNVEMNNLCLT